MSHLYLAVSSHGYGHLAQISPLVNELGCRYPDLRITLQSDLPEEYVRRRLLRFDHWYRRIDDAGMVMHSALDVDAEASLKAYQVLSRDTETLLERQKALLEEAAPDLLLADIPHIPLLAAQSLGLPNFAVCSLNWADILAAYCGNAAQSIVDELRHAYSAADGFIKPAPSIPMEWLPNGVAVGPFMQGAESRRTELVERLGVATDTRLVMVNLGGVTYGIKPSNWCVPGDHCWLAPSEWAALNPALRDYQGLGMPFADILASVDVILTKPGYGIFTEAAYHGIPVLTVERGDWPEEPYLEQWMRERVGFAVLDRQRFLSGDFADELARLAASGRCSSTPASGIAEAIDILRPFLE